MSIRRNVAFFGIKRNGNHALQNWILHQIPERTCVFNQAEIGLNPLEVHHFRVFKDMQMAFNGRRLFGATYDGPVENNSIFYTYENIELHTIKNGISMGKNNLLSIQREKPFDYNANIMVLRDPFNMLASLYADYHRAKALRMWPPPEKYISLWKAHAREFLGIASFLEADDTLKVCISYNDWFTKEEYRRSISDQLNLEFSDEGLQFVNNFGEGSSFDNQKYKYNAQEMKVLTRWKQAVDRNSEWENILKQLQHDSELMEYAEEIFDLKMIEIK